MRHGGRRWPFTGGTIAVGVVDICYAPYLGVEREITQTFAKD
jgi:hypothetical protein